MSASLLPGTRVVQIAISQLFQMVDLLTYPDSVRARGFLKAIREPAAMRRALNRPLEIQIGNLGKLRPVAIAQDRFWRGSVPDLRRPGTSPLFFLPFELSLSDRLALGFAPGSDLETVLGAAGGLVENHQAGGRLRIYPPGTGVVQVTVTLTFREAVDVEAVARMAQHVEDLLFVDAAGQAKPPSELFFDVIDQVDKALFLQGNEDRRWQPPQTVYSLRDAGSSDPAPWLPELARLMSLAPGNEQQAGFLESRLSEALRSSSWRTERTLAVAGQDVALLIAGLEPRDKRIARLEVLAETRELVSAAAYAEQAFIEELGQIVGEGRLDASWLPGQGTGFDYLLRLLETMGEVLRAISSLRFLERLPVRVLNAFARDVWTYSNPVRPALLRQRLDEVERWYSARSGPEVAKEIGELQERIRRIEAIESLFPDPADREDELSARREPGTSRKVRIFFSYAHEDKELREQLDEHLSGLKSSGRVEGWSDRKIGAGREWAGQISDNLEKADLVLFLVSKSFMASRYSQDVEVKRAMERHEAGTARVIPVILRPVDWSLAPFEKLQALPEEGKPVINWRPRDEGFKNVALGIRRTVEELLGLPSES
ncbi:MAG TPA: toll/interleukin-1 receptor domain-containing protein [Thermoanaerobaculia bacterium]|nr:toll/interleukin-1 receptor domain-containing protein [Thermoanaerobaculia bacterium]